MTREILISRRTVFSLIGVALPATILTLSEAKAQTAGEERREERREDRRDERSGIVDQPVTTGTGTGAVEGPTYHGGPKSDD
jgi:hypothetical protein